MEVVTHYLNLFFIYSFIGFVWETSYTLVKKKKLVKRGFLHGPILPIYGFGALIILLATNPIHKNLFYVFVVGLFSATLLELMTGYLIEKIFGVRYWNYDHEKFNFHGYICPKCSLFWGILSVVLVRYVNTSIEAVIQKVRTVDVDYLTYILFFIFILDCIRSIREAFELKELIKLQQRAAVYVKGIKKRLHSFASDGKEKAIQLIDNLNGENTISSTKASIAKHTVHLENILDDRIEQKREMEQRIKDRLISTIEQRKQNMEQKGVSDKIIEMIHSIYDKRLLMIDHLERAARSIVKRNDVTLQEKEYDETPKLKKKETKERN